MLELKKVKAESHSPQFVTLKAPAGLNTDDLTYWTARAAIVLGQPVFIKCREPITFNREDFSGSTGTVFPTGPNTFTIEDIDGRWTQSTGTDVITMADEAGRQYLAYKYRSKFYFAEGNCEREDEDPRVAFAKLMYSIV